MGEHNSGPSSEPSHTPPIQHGRHKSDLPPGPSRGTLKKGLNPTPVQLRQPVDIWVKLNIVLLKASETLRLFVATAKANSGKLFHLSVFLAFLILTLPRRVVLRNKTNAGKALAHSNGSVSTSQHCLLGTLLCGRMHFGNCVCNLGSNVARKHGW